MARAMLAVLLCVLISAGHATPDKEGSHRVSHFSFTNNRPHDGCTPEMGQPLQGTAGLNGEATVRYSHACQIPAARFVHWELYWDPTNFEGDSPQRHLRPPQTVLADQPPPEPLPFAGVVFQTPGIGCVDPGLQGGFTFTQIGDAVAEEYPLQEWYYANARARQVDLSPSGASTSTRRLAGALVNLVTPFSENFQHVPFDVLPLLKLVWSARGVKRLRPKFLVLGSWAATFLHALGIPEHRIVVADPVAETLYCADSVISPRFVAHTASPLFPVRMGVRPEGFLSRIRRKLAGDLWPGARNARPRLVLYLHRPRGRARGLLPAAETALLTAINRTLAGTPFQLTTFQSAGDWRDDRRVFAEAAAVVGPHGGAEANLIFCPPGTTVVEFNPMSQLVKSGESNVRPCYLGLSRMCNLDYWVVEPTEGFTFVGRGPGMVVNPSHVTTILQQTILSKTR